MGNYCEVIKRIILEANPYEEFENHTNLIETEILNSLTLFYLVSELEEHYEIIIPENLFAIENFSSVENIAKLVNEIMGWSK